LLLGGECFAFAWLIHYVANSPSHHQGTDASGDAQSAYAYVGQEWTRCFIMCVQGLFHDNLPMRMEICRCPVQNEHGAFLSSLVVLVVDLFSSIYQCFGQGRKSNARAIRYARSAGGDRHSASAS
jgi:hypothetical protein